VLSNSFLKQLEKFLEIEAEALKPVHDYPHVRQQGRVPQREFVQYEPFPTPFQLLRGSVSLGLCDRRWRGIGRGDGRWRRSCHGDRCWRGTGRRAGRWRRSCKRLRPGLACSSAVIILPFLLSFPRGRLVIGRTSFAGPLSAIMLAASERTSQILAAGIPRIGEKANLAVRAVHHALRQSRIRMILDRQGERTLILLNQRFGAAVLIPIFPKREELADSDKKKPNSRLQF